MDRTLKKRILQQFERYRLCSFLSDDSAVDINERKAFMRSVEHAVQRLPELEREIITRRYLPLEGEYIKDYSVYEELGISQPIYAKCRERAFSKLAAAWVIK